ncbi:MAG: hypothetical protein HRF50_02595 [Phycisphaerae bacterium]
MPHSESAAPKAQERKVNPRIPGWMVLLAVLGAVAGAAWWSWQRTEQQRVPVQRSGFDFIVQWSCEKGHAFSERGAAGAKPCPTCGGECFPTFSAFCTGAGCGKQDRFQLRYDDKGKIAGFRWGLGGEWQAYVFPPKCRACGAVMRPG